MRTSARKIGATVLLGAVGVMGLAACDDQSEPKETSSVLEKGEGFKKQPNETTLEKDRKIEKDKMGKRLGQGIDRETQNWNDIQRGNLGLGDEGEDN